MKKISLIIIALIFSKSMMAQDFETLVPERHKVHEKDINLLTPVEILEDSLIFMADSMYFSAIEDNRISGSYEFIRIFKNYLKTPNTFNSPASKLKDKIVIINAPDNSFKIYNWEIVRNNIERRYYGAIQMPDGNFVPLVDVSDQIIRGAEDSIFSNSRWFGNLYYNIVQKNFAGQQLYFLFGWNGNSVNSEKKIVDVLTFDERNRIVFGAPIFNNLERGQRSKRNRMILEYQKGAKVSMNFDAESQRIIFDHCESQIGDPAKKYTYTPDGTYDGMSWDGTQWIMGENIIQISDLQQGNAPIEKPIK